MTGHRRLASVVLAGRDGRVPAPCGAAGHAVPES